MLFTLCGCDFIDDVRDSYVYRLDNGNLKCADSIYIMYPNSLGIAHSGMFFSDRLGICLDNEPILWAYMQDNYFHYREEWCNINEKRTVIYSPDTQKYYIREDVYDELSKELDAFINGDCFIVYDRLEEGKKQFSKEDSKILFETLKQPPAEPELIMHAVTSSRYSLYLYSANGNFTAEIYYDAFYNRYDGNYYLDTIASGGNIYLAAGKAAELVKEIIDANY